MADFLEFWPILLQKEGGFVNHPADKGGPTKYGITLQTLSSWLKRTCTAVDVQNLTLDNAQSIYKRNYWDACGCSGINSQELANFICDFAVNSGVFTASICAQKAAEVKQDGKIGPKTLFAINNNVLQVFTRMKADRLNLIARIVQRKPSQKVFEKGWLNRINSFQAPEIA